MKRNHLHVSVPSIGEAVAYCEDEILPDTAASACCASSAAVRAAC